MHDHKLGETVPIEVTFVDGKGQATSPTGVIIWAKRQDGTVINGEVSAGTGPGQFQTAFLADATGTWLVKAEGTVIVQGKPAVIKDETRFTVSRLWFDSP